MKGADMLCFFALLCTVGGSQFMLAQAATSFFSINEGDFACGVGGNLICSGNATTASGLLKLTPDPLGRRENEANTVGVALYSEPVQLLNSSSTQAAFFRASFSFRIESAFGVNFSGDGMAFVMFADKTWTGAPGSNFGAYDGSGNAVVRTLAVEFVTHETEGVDLDGNHVGIDTNSINSDVAQSVPFQLAGGSRVYAWVDYDAATSVLEVRVSDTSEKPKQALVSQTEDLLDIFETEKTVWVGFSGANGNCDCFNYYTVYDLSFASSFASFPASEPSSTDASRVSMSFIASISVGILVGVYLLLDRYLL